MYFGSKRWHVYQNDDLVFDEWFTYRDAIDWAKRFNESTRDVEDVVFYTARRDR